MRRRLIVSSVGLVLLTVLLLGIPLGLVARRLVLTDAQHRVSHDAESIARVLDRTSEPITPVHLRDIAPFGVGVHVQLPDGRVVTSGVKVAGSVLAGSDDGDRGETVTVIQSAAGAHKRVLELWGVIAVVAVGAVIAAGAYAVWQANRLSRPLVALARLAERVGTAPVGRPDRATQTVVRGSRVPELVALADALDRSAHRVTTLLERERQFASNASHQLRTPLTALRLRLEDLLVATPAGDDPEVAEEIHAALRQVDRLAGVVEDLLLRTRTGRGTGASLVDLSAEARDRLREWLPLFEREGRAVNFTADDDCEVYATPVAMSEVLDVLLDNALSHGSGAVEVEVARRGQLVQMSVTDAGPGIPADLAPHIFDREVSGGGGTGLGLALARALVEHDGGRLELRQPIPPLFVVVLPAADAGLTREVEEVSPATR